MREWQFAKRLSFLSPELSGPPKLSSLPSLAAGDRLSARIQSKCYTVIFAGCLDTPPAFHEQTNEEKRTTKKKEKTKKLLPLLQKTWSWRIWVSIPVLPACKAGALPFELIPQSISHFGTL